MPHYNVFYSIIIETTDGHIHKSPKYTNNPDDSGFVALRDRLAESLQEIGRNGGFYINQKTLTAYPVKRVYVKTRTGY